MKENKDLNEKIAFVITFHICFMQCKNMLVSTSELLYAHNSKLNMIAMVLIAILYGRLFLINKRFRFMDRRLFFIVCVIPIWWGISYCIDPRLFTDTVFPYNYVKRQATTFVVYGFPLFVVSSYMTDVKTLLNKLYKTVPITFIVATISMILYIVNPRDSMSYSMSFGNQMLLICVCLVFRYIDEGRKRDIFMFVVTVGYIFLGGSRGPLVSIFVLCIYWLFTIESKRKRNISIIVLCYIAIPVIAFWKEIFTMIYNVLYNRGIKSRTLFMLINDMGTKDSGRSLYHETLLNEINKSPILGLGAFGGEKTVGLAHSLYIDIFANLGYVFGIIFIILILFGIYKQMMKKNDRARSKVIAMMAIILFPRGFFDESFWGTWQLWVIMGLLLGSKNKEETNQEGSYEKSSRD